jgi:hypothetical protein
MDSRGPIFWGRWALNPSPPLPNTSFVASAIYSKKYLKKAKEELWKLKYFTMQKYNIKKIFI